MTLSHISCLRLIKHLLLNLAKYGCIRHLVTFHDGTVKHFISRVRNIIVNGRGLITLYFSQICELSTNDRVIYWCLQGKPQTSSSVASFRTRVF